MKAIGVMVTALNFKFLMADILEKQKNPASITFKKMAFYRVNRPFKDSIYQNKGFKRIKSFKPSNRCKKPDRGSNYNTYPEEDEKASKDVEN